MWYQFSGFSRSDHAKRFTIILDSADELGAPWEGEKEIAGPDICFATSSNISAEVPADCKGVLLKTADLYARLPELNPDYRHPRKRRA